MEEEIGDLENRMNALNAKISDQTGYNPELINEYQGLQKKLDEAMRLWEAETAKYEILEADSSK